MGWLLWVLILAPRVFPQVHWFSFNISKFQFDQEVLKFPFSYFVIMFHDDDDDDDDDDNNGKEDGLCV